MIELGELLVGVVIQRTNIVTGRNCSLAHHALQLWQHAIVTRLVASDEVHVHSVGWVLAVEPVGDCGVGRELLGAQVDDLVEQGLLLTLEPEQAAKQVEELGPE